jgi:hypothetical protein
LHIEPPGADIRAADQRPASIHVHNAGRSRTRPQHLSCAERPVDRRSSSKDSREHNLRLEV